MAEPVVEGLQICTIGHGNRPIEELTDLLHGAGVTCLVDVRAYPGSRRNPQFAREALALSLPEAAIRYVWEGSALGGRRRPRADSPHVSLRNDSFRAYADHMQSDTFADGIERLAMRARDAVVAIMCAERLPWQCHRYMISDYLVAHGATVLHLIGAAKPRAHAVRTEARLVDGELIYDVNSQPQLGL